MTQAGIELPPGTWPVDRHDTLDRVAEEEEHCIGSYAGDLRCGALHAIVIESPSGGPRALLTVYENIDHESEEGTVREYTTKEVRTAKNRTAEPAQRTIADAIVARWNQTLKEHRSRGQPLAVGKAKMAARVEHEHRTISLERCRAYWREVLDEAVPEWLRILAPDRGGVARMLENGTPQWTRLYQIGQTMASLDMTGPVGLRNAADDYIARARESRAQPPASAAA